MKKILPINKENNISSYVHHAYPNSIINRETIAKLYVQGVNDWAISNYDVTYKIDSEVISIYENKGRMANCVELERLCKKDDEIIVKLCDIKLDDAMSNILLGLRQGNDGLKEENIVFSFWWNQYDVTIKKEHFIPSNHFFAYYKLRTENKKLRVDLSVDMKEWKTLYEIELSAEICNENLYLYIKFYFGNNQYEQWLNMNYIQLFYNENDPNTAYLDYYMFPRKLSDASYQYFCHFLDTEYIDFQKCQKSFDYNFHNFVVASVEQDYYLNVCLNEFYIPDRKAYGKYDYEHYNLLYGFDDEKSLYYILGYNARGKIVTTSLTYEDMEKCLCRGPQIVRYVYRVNKYEYQFQASVFIQTIEEFLNGADSSKKFGNLLCNCEGKYGIGIFDELVYSKAGRKLVVSDLRISYVLYEHSTLMFEKLAFLGKYGYIDESEKNALMIPCKRMLHLSEIIKNLVIKNSVKFLKDKNRIFELLIQLKEQEHNFFSMLLDIMKGKGEIKDND